MSDTFHETALGHPVKSLQQLGKIVLKNDYLGCNTLHTHRQSGTTTTTMTMRGKKKELGKITVSCVHLGISYLIAPLLLLLLAIAPLFLSSLCAPSQVLYHLFIASAQCQKEITTLVCASK